MQHSYEELNLLSNVRCFEKCAVRGAEGLDLGFIAQGLKGLKHSVEAVPYRLFFNVKDISIHLKNL